MRGESNIMVFERIKVTHSLAPHGERMPVGQDLLQLDKLANKGVLIHRILYSPFLSQLIHLFHD